MTDTGRKGKTNEIRGARVRTCAGCGRKRRKEEMLRIVRTPDGEILPDPEGKTDGRGTYLCPEMACLEKARKRKSPDRTLKTAVPQEVYDRLREVLEDNGTE